MASRIERKLLAPRVRFASGSADFKRAHGFLFGLTEVVSVVPWRHHLRHDVLLENFFMAENPSTLC